MVGLMLTDVVLHFNTKFKQSKKERERGIIVKNLKERFSPQTRRG